VFVVEAAETGGHHAAAAEVADRFALVGAGGESMALPFTIPDDWVLGELGESDEPSVWLALLLLMDA